MQRMKKTVLSWTLAVIDFRLFTTEFNNHQSNFEHRTCILIVRRSVLLCIENVSFTRTVADTIVVIIIITYILCKMEKSKMVNWAQKKMNRLDKKMCSIPLECGECRLRYKKPPECWIMIEDKIAVKAKHRLANDSVITASVACFDYQTKHVPLTIDSTINL